MSQHVAIAGRIEAARPTPRAVLRHLRYSLTLVPGILVVLGNLEGRYLTLGCMIWGVFLGVADWFSREDKRPPESAPTIVPDLVLFLQALLHTAAIVTLLWSISNGVLKQTFLWLAVFSTGIHSGVNGINSSHELIHRRNRWWRRAGFWNLLLLNYGHWFSSHLRIHHRWVGTEKDPVWARRGETIYGFLLRVLPQQFMATLRLEGDRTARRGQWRYGPANFVVQCLMAQAALGAAIIAIFGRNAFGAWLAQCVVAVFDLEFVNYLQHYGLAREPGASLTASHAWVCNHVSSRYSLIELTRHPDHHLHASKPYQTLCNLDESPEYPVGYSGLMLVALVPWWWFAKVHPLLDAHQAAQKKPATPAVAGRAFPEETLARRAA